MADRKKRSTTFPIVMIIILFVGVFAASIYISLNPDILTGITSGTPTPTSIASPTPSATPAPVSLQEAVLCSIDSENSVLTFFIPKKDTTLSLTYDKSTYFYNRFGESRTVSSFSAGDITNLSYYPETAVLISLSPFSDAWTYTDISLSAFNTPQQLVEINNRNYRVNSTACVFKAGSLSAFSALHALDALTVKGVGDTVYSVIVATGHGQLLIENARDFIGGFLFVNEATHSEITSVAELYALPEGTYTFSVKNGERYAEKQFTIKDGETVVFDLLEFSDKPPLKGTVSFVVEPSKAQLFINKKLHNHTESISLDYGSYNIEVLLSGYLSYNDTLTVNSAKQTVQIFLPKENEVSEHFKPIITATPTPEPTASPTPIVTVSPTPSPEPTASPTPSPTPIPKNALLIYWHPNTDIYLDAKHIGKTDASGMLTIEAVTGTHIFSLSPTIASLEYKIVEISTMQNYINLYYY